MTLLHQAAQKAVEARQYEDSDPGDCPELNMSNYDHNDVAALNAWAVQAWHCIARQTRELAALQQQEVPREPVGHVHKDWHASQGQGRIYGHCPGSDYVQVYASPSTTQQQEVKPTWAKYRDEQVAQDIKVVHEAFATQQQEVGSEPDTMEAHRTNGLAWAVSCWQAEVMNRPLVNVHRRTLDDTWRQVIRYFGGDPDKLLGPNHDTLHMRAQEERAWKP